MLNITAEEKKALKGRGYIMTRDGEHFIARVITVDGMMTDEELAEQQIYQNTIRLSIGTEHIDDIIADLEAGFAAVRGE